MRKYLVPILIAVVLAVALGTFLISRGGAEMSYRVAKVESGPIVSFVSAAGSVQLSDSLPVVAQTAGVATRSFADYNAVVKAGDVLASIDPTAANARLSTARADLDGARGSVEIASSQIELARRQVDSARATLASARATASSVAISMKDAESDLALKRKLVASQDASAAEAQRAESVRSRAATDLTAAQAREAAAAASYEASEAQLAVSQAQLNNARAMLAAREVAVAQAELDVDHASVRAPIDGVVMSRNVVVGKPVNVGEVLYTLAEDAKKIEVIARVDEGDIARVQPGQTVQFRVSSYPDVSFSGHVTGVQRMPQVAEAVVIYNVSIAADNPEGKLLPGMTAQVYIFLDRRDLAVKIPRAALRFVPSDLPADRGAAAEPVGRETVWRLVGDRLQLVPVRTGITDGLFSELVEGDLQAGQDGVVGEAKRDSRSALSF